jgi:hypothetical protein
MSRRISERAVTAASGVLSRRVGRRDLLRRAAIVGSALAVAPADFLLRPGTAYGSVCGPGSSCSSGWTAMCCTVHRGVNQCPPGTFPGGWWRADSARLCGGGSRYYIDCQAECTCGCGGGASFCSAGCWNCKAHCASGTCDERRVCWNVFRYGQCTQDVGCSGPVHCRMISCVPPWEFLDCTSEVAVDQATVDHNAPCLPTQWSAIQARYAQLGGAGSVLGAEIDAEYRFLDGTAQKCQHGRLFHSHSTGARYVLDPILGHYLLTADKLGLPTTDQRRTEQDGGRYNLFQHGAIYWTAATGAHMVRGRIGKVWDRLGRGGSPLGFPTHDPRRSSNGQAEVQTFQHGEIYHTAATGTHALWGQVFQKYRAVGSHLLGYPTTDVRQAAGGEYARFSNGSIAGAHSIGWHDLYGRVDTAWWQHGGPTGKLGLPTSDERTLSSGDRTCDFQHGTITYDPTTGQVIVTVT